MRIFPFSSVRCVLFLLVVMASAGPSFGQVAISITVTPPPLPVYEQPLCPGEDYIWTPGYWAWDTDDDDYYWVPGTWVLVPEPGLLWTPPYWAWVDASFVFYDGYWGPRSGLLRRHRVRLRLLRERVRRRPLGEWTLLLQPYREQRECHHYSQCVQHDNHNTTINHVSYNGGQGGVNARPTPEEEAAAHERHVPPVPAKPAPAGGAGKSGNASLEEPGQAPGRGHSKTGSIQGPRCGAGHGRGSAVSSCRQGCRKCTAHGEWCGPAGRHHSSQRSSSPGTPVSSQHRRPETGSEIFAGTGKAIREAGTGKAGAAAKAGSGPSASGAPWLPNAARMQELEKRHQQQTIQLQQRHDMQSQRQQTRLQAASPAQPRPPSRPR